MYYILICLFILSLFLTSAFRNYAIKKGLVDKPNNRSLHKHPTARGGGIVFVSLWIVFTIIATLIDIIPIHLGIALVISVAIIALISYYDDHVHIRPLWRALAHLLAAIIFVILVRGITYLDFGTFDIPLGLIGGSIVAILMLAWSTNLFNFMDGTDGFAGFEACFIFGVAGLVFRHHEDYQAALFAWSVVPCVLGFLYWNWPKAKIFMGDVGSTSLGFLIMAFAILSQKYYHLPIILWLMLYGVFLVDATYTLLRRMIRGAKWYEAHNEQALHRMYFQAKWPHYKILYGLILLDAVILIFVLSAVDNPAHTFYFALAEFAFLTLVYGIIEWFYPVKRQIAKNKN